VCKINKEKIIEIIKDEADYFGWSYDTAIENLAKLNFTIERVVDNELFNESKIRNVVAMAYHAIS
jgi:hypothetical protein